MQYHQLSASSETNPRNSLAATIYQTPDASKESLNLLVLIAELYNAQVISARLIYDLIRGFVDSGSEIGEAIGEREVEGLLKIIRCGYHGVAARAV
jgi:nucleolar MIF4G domain-containing protein 1